MNRTGDRWCHCQQCRHVFRVSTMVQYERDDARARVVIVSEADAALAARLLILDRQASEQAWSYTMLHEARGATRLTSSDVREIVSHAAALSRRHGERGAEAIVAVDIVTFGMARVYSTLAEHAGIAVHVFHSPASAEQWMSASSRVRRA